MNQTTTAHRSFTADVTTPDGQTTQVVVHATDERHARAALLKRFGFGARIAL